MIDPELLDLYSARMKVLAASMTDAVVVNAAHAVVQRRSPLCGSQVTFSVVLDSAGQLSALGYDVQACALAAAASAIVVSAALGLSLSDLSAVRDQVRAMLKGQDVVFPGGRWADLDILRPAEVVPSRHGSVMLPFDTLVDAFSQALDAHSSDNP
ncbi:iron-sulfur cluster assembly scaffold protein [Haematospirillum jordaniae]|uniref:iron-sulfur cluster assembly scaffold protein n=1 Tax=Haematospirillum jordaniae TaxID=1549855 RepID=UPI001432EDC7|nr:iron-sulfur cluster assembly scaffold protein [Haematospirillum jordaniae]NKD44278.1 iron-sulfur cluster assembly scaffold protein [Haematospirillum jordaniae]NKD91555.1 iron-sulfur cluster assembly scaffold protein [Haematospirillum jordaniae]